LPSLGLFGLDFDERGLLGLAFHPDYATNGKLYTFTSEPVTGPADFTVADLPPLDAEDLRHQSVVAEWQVSIADPDVVDPGSRRELLRIDNPQFNHNAGMLNFGPGGNLFIAIGDGGAANDDAPGHGLQGNGQNPANVLGTILRIDVDGNNSANGEYGIPVAAPFSTLTTDPTGTIPDEIFAYGFRNPYRFNFDSETGALIVGDVGQDNIEEVDIVTAGGNFGWRFKEGSFAFDFTDGSVSNDLTGIPPGLNDPVLEYDHDEGISVIGGFVYRGSAIPELVGNYVFGDFTDEGFVTPYMVSSHFARRDVFNDRDKIASVYPAC
jgi:glucose/arabinose dehydrogenase